MTMKDKNGKELKEGNIVSCNGLYFEIDSFKTIKSGETMACGVCGCLNTDLLEKVDESKVFIINGDE